MRILVLISLFMYSLGIGQNNTSQWATRWSKPSAKAGETVELIITCTISDNWYMYGSDFNPDLGPTVTTLEVTPHASFKTTGKLASIGRKEKYDSLWGGKITYFLHHAEFRIKVIAQENNPKINALVRYQVCSDAEMKCIPGTFEFTAPPLKVIGVTKKEEPISTPNPVKKDSTPTVKSGVQPSRPTLQTLENEKQKSIIKDAQGKDVSTMYLRRFIKKYAGK